MKWPNHRSNTTWACWGFLNNILSKLSPLCSTKLFFVFSRAKCYNSSTPHKIYNVLTISCTLNFPDSLSFVEDWIRFSCDGSLLGFLRVGDADFDFNLSFFFSGKFCLCDLDADSIKAKCFDEAGLNFCLSVVSTFQRSKSMTRFLRKTEFLQCVSVKWLSLHFPTPSWINKSHSPLGVCRIFPWYTANGVSAMIWKMAGNFRGKLPCNFRWKRYSQESLPSSL